MSQVRRQLLIALVIPLSVAGCQRSDPPRRYPLQGQVLAVQADRREITIKHGDIAGYMPAMTMSYPVASPALLQGRVPGELVSATLEVTAAAARLVEIAHTGSAPLPAGSNEIALASGVLGVGDVVPDVALIDQANRRRTLAEWRGTATLLTFIYTRCPLPNFCPLMNQNFAAVQRTLDREAALHGRVKLVSVSFDPDHDTPEVLAERASDLHADPAVWTFLTADWVTVDRFAAQFGVAVMRAPDASGQITHTLRTVFIGADGRIVKIYSGSDWTPGLVIADMRAALGPAK